MTELKLNLGCGRQPLPGYVNLDKFPGDGVDIVCDLEGGVLPFNDDSVDYINSDSVFEHIFHWERLMPEMLRILKPDGIVRINVPYKTVALTPFHVRYFQPDTMDIFCYEYGQTWSLENGPMYHKYRVHICRTRPFRWILNKYMGVALDSSWGYKKEAIIFELQKPSDPEKYKVGKKWKK